MPLYQFHSQLCTSLIFIPLLSAHFAKLGIVFSGQSINMVLSILPDKIDVMVSNIMRFNHVLSTFSISHQQHYYHRHQWYNCAVEKYSILVQLAFLSL